MLLLSTTFDTRRSLRHLRSQPCGRTSLSRRASSSSSHPFDVTMTRARVVVLEYPRLL